MKGKMKSKMNMKQVAVLVIGLVALAGQITAGPQHGTLTANGDFTLNHLYSFNDPSLYPFGTFGSLFVDKAKGSFAIPRPHATQVFVSSNGNLWTVSPLPVFTFTEYTVTTSAMTITGADFLGRLVSGVGVVNGNGLVDEPVRWYFTAPPYDISNFHEDITGPITLTITR